MAKDFPEYTFAIADEEDYATEVKDLGLSESGEDVNAAILDESGKKFAMEPEEFDSDALENLSWLSKRKTKASYQITASSQEQQGTSQGGSGEDL